MDELPTAGAAVAPAAGAGGAPGGLTARAVASEPSLRLRLVLPGDGAPVRWAHPTELLDAGPYLRGGELVCTVGVALVDAAACGRFVASLAAAGAVGVCFGAGDVHPTVPPALVEACGRHGLALMVAERGVPFIALGEHLAQHRVDAAVAAERAGRLLDLVGDAVASPEALLPLLVDAGLAHGALVVRAWPLDALPAAPAPQPVPTSASASALVPALVGTGAAASYRVTAHTDGVPPEETVAATTDGAPCGVSRPVRWRELGAAVREARRALARATAVQAPEDGGPTTDPTLEALAARLEPALLEPFVERLVRPLLRTGRPHDADLVSTLEDYLRLDGSLVETARARYLHVNSVRHRLERVAALTGTDPTTLTDSAAFALALWAHGRRDEGS